MRRLTLVVDINGGNDVASVSNLTRWGCNDVWRTQHGSVGRFLHCGKPWFRLRRAVQRLRLATRPAAVISLPGGTTASDTPRKS